MRRVLQTMLLVTLCTVNALAQPQTLPPPFPRTNATKLFDNDRINVWDIVWPKGQPTALHRHVYDQVGTYYRDLQDARTVSALALVPLRAKRGALWNGYRVGYWPGERAGRAASRYPLPEGFLEVTPENQDQPLSVSFRVRDFLTHDQAQVWPKVLVIRLPLLDKLELIAAELEALGRPSALRVMSGFRTPQYNALGVGPRGGRARDSRHMYGDAADIYVDADGNGQMDDLDGDGRVTVRDARWLAGLADRVEQAHPTVTGGIGVYRATAAHGPFVHVDVRGTPARW